MLRSKVVQRISTIVLVALAGLATACIPKIKEPDVRLVGVRVGGLGLQGGLLYVRLSVVNPNDFPLVADGLTYDIEVSDPAADGDGWAELAEGTFREEVRVEGGDSTMVEIPVEFRYTGVGGVLRSIIDTGTFSYRINGRVAVEKPLRTEIPYRHRGVVSVTSPD
jgi:LEA14-like dessication related protein